MNPNYIVTNDISVFDYRIVMLKIKVTKENITNENKDMVTALSGIAVRSVLESVTVKEHLRSVLNHVAAPNDAPKINRIDTI